MGLALLEGLLDMLLLREFQSQYPYPTKTDLKKSIQK
jgi:hypothetical protein